MLSDDLGKTIENNTKEHKIDDKSLGDVPTINFDSKSIIGIVDRYELLEKIGEGGFGAVYCAKDVEARILVALKALPKEISRDADEMAAIRDNFALVHRLHHPNIASLLHLHKVTKANSHAHNAMGIKENDYLVVMEYAKGATLFATLRTMPNRKMTLEQALEICRPIATALDYAHSQKILHRDIKTKNIMVSRENGLEIKVLDFGLAAEIRSSMTRKSKAPQNSKSGTPLYMSPEQWAGKKQHAAADQYALAIVIYELLDGEVPFKSAFDSGNMQLMRDVVLNNSIEPINVLTKKQNLVLSKALSKDPSLRFDSCKSFIDALETGKIPKKNINGAKKTFMLTLTLIVTIALAGGYWLLNKKESQEPTTPIEITNGINKSVPTDILGSNPENNTTKETNSKSTIATTETKSIPAINTDSEKETQEQLEYNTAEQNYIDRLGGNEKLLNEFNNQSWRDAKNLVTKAQDTSKSLSNRKDDYEQASTKLKEAIKNSQDLKSVEEAKKNYEDKLADNNELLNRIDNSDWINIKSLINQAKTTSDLQDKASKYNTAATQIDDAVKNAKTTESLQKQLQEKQKSANTQKNIMEQSKESAEKASASQYASATFDKATNLEQEGQTAYNKQDYPGAESKWNDSADAFTTAQHEAEDTLKQNYFQAQSSWSDYYNKNTFGYIEGHGDVTLKDIKTYAEDEFSAAIQTANSSEKNTNYTQGTDDYKTALTTLKSAVEKTLERMKKSAIVTINSIPEYATIYDKQNNIVLGSTGDEIELKPFITHNITVQANGYKDQKIPLASLRPNEKVTQSVELEKKEIYTENKEDKKETKKRVGFTL